MSPHDPAGAAGAVVLTPEEHALLVRYLRRLVEAAEAAPAWDMFAGRYGAALRAEYTVAATLLAKLRAAERTEATP